MSAVAEQLTSGPGFSDSSVVEESQGADNSSSGIDEGEGLLAGCTHGTPHGVGVGHEQQPHPVRFNQAQVGHLHLLPSQPPQLIWSIDHREFWSGSSAYGINQTPLSLSVDS